MTTSRNRLTTVILGGLSLMLMAGAAWAQTPMSYSGDISPTFGSVNDTCAFEITLWDATSDGTRIGPVIERELPVRGGLYETDLDFGPAAVEGGSRYLEVSVGCPAGTAGLTTLTRRAFHPAASEPATPQDGGNTLPHAAGAPPKAALGTGFTYQGELKESGSPVTGLGDFQFSLWDALQGGNQIGASVPASAIGVEDGRFTTQLDFGAAAFDGDARWLQIAVDYPSGTGSFTTLSPRQPLSAAPYALQTRGIFVDDINRVGIGTDTPAHPLHVVGSAMVDGDLHIDSGHDIELSDPSNRIFDDLGDLRLESGDDVRINPSNDFIVDSSTLVVDSSTNRVGIGTLAPDVALDVIGDIELASGHWIGIGPSSERINFDGGGNDLEILGADLGIGTTSPDEMLHVENTAAVGLAFLKLQTSHPSVWGETGIRFETPQNRWHLRMDDYGNGNIPEGALGLRCNTPGHEIMTWTEDGTVGIGTTQPLAKLDVEGKVLIEATDEGSGWVRTLGANGLANAQISYLLEHPNNGYVSVKDEWGTTQAAIWVNQSGSGIVTGDLKAFHVPYPERPELDIWYASLEGPEAAMYVRGTGRLVDGRATITLPGHFRKLALESSMTMQLTPGSLASQGLAVGALSLDGIEVGELHGGSGSYDFHWVVTAVRRAHQGFQVIRPWTEALAGGHLDQSDRWAARLKSIQAREFRLLEIEAKAPASQQ